MKRTSLALIFLMLPLAAQAASDPLRKTARQLGLKIASSEKPRVAILAFPYHDGKISSGSSIISERLTTYLAAVKGVRIVERSLLRKLLEEQHLSETGMTDPSAVRKIGKILDVDVIVTGTLIESADGRTEVNARALQAGTGEVIAASRLSMKKVWNDSPRFPKPLFPELTDEDIEAKAPSNEAIEIGYPMGGGAGGRGKAGFGGRR